MAELSREDFEYALRSIQIANYVFVSTVCLWVFFLHKAKRGKLKLLYVIVLGSTLCVIAIDGYVNLKNSSPQVCNTISMPESAISALLVVCTQRFMVGCFPEKQGNYIVIIFGLLLILDLGLVTVNIVMMLSLKYGYSGLLGE
ncbi:hypothetical protein CONPUDRAFT_140875 [Coniophora puteana RWD-64-598 SS2]|uniref:Uncharacterized protein n=1 Tax=Coniophora puteana (strain RWD-64-598) TaxID=741705 RepID=A0A5M3N5S0_CONPW|nr:uncharacterized protein CONPUDRAFT_140875 [Coniophora puteana RWD-64-598 SS2]EIW86211.1 hypothetical protein CONPUDRAFT_140875 [Coniophora puteana RWD-64-598 SS2]